MKITLVKPNVKYYEQYNEMIEEWLEIKTHIAPWFLGEKYESEKEFSKYVNMLNNCEASSISPNYPTQSSYFVLDENKKMIGACRLAHYLCLDVTTNNGKKINVWGHIGYGIRPSKRGKGYATEVVKQLLVEARKRDIKKVYIGVYEDNKASRRVIEKSGGILIDTVNILESTKKIRRYYIDNTK